MPLPNVDRTSLLNRTILYFLSIEEKLARPAPPPPPIHHKTSSSSQPSSSHDYPELHATLRSTQDKQASLQAYIETEHALLPDFV